MSKLTSLRKQIAALQEEEARILRAAMDGSIAKVKKLMNSLGVTLEHLGSSMTASATKNSAPTKATGKRTRGVRSGVGTAKYTDPASGKTWSGFGRAPAWLASAKNRDDYLTGAVKVSASKAASKTKATTVAKVPAETVVKTGVKKAAKKTAPVSKKPAKAVAKKATAAKSAKSSRATQAAAQPSDTAVTATQ